jgi:hypothetical protein
MSAHATATASGTAAVTRRLPLYLYGQSATQVDADGPALVVRITHKAPLRYPFARLARVIVGPRVEWHARALAACQHAGLPIVFLDAAGEPSGYLQPAQGKPSRLDSDIEEMLDRADWPMHYNHWLRARRMELLRDWRRARLATGNTLDEDDFRELVRQHVYRPETERVDFPQASPQTGALTAYTLQALHQAGLKPRYWSQQGDPLELAGDLTHLLCLALHLEMHGLGAGLRGDNAALLRVLHSFGPRINQLLPQLLGSLHRRLKTLLEEWR